MKLDPVLWHSTYTRFRASRERIWIPKIFSSLKELVKSATDFNSIDAAIANLYRLQITDLDKLLLDLYVDAGRVMGGKAYQQVMQQVRKLPGVKSMLPMGVNEELVNDIIAYLQLHNLQMVGEITDTMKAWILKQLIAGQQEGKSITQVADAMIADNLTKNRSIIIARTETIKAANAGALFGAKKSGYKMNKQWVSARDNRTRRIPRDEFSHLAMDGINIPVDEAFQVPSKNGGYDSLSHPGDPKGSAADVIQCRCTIGFVVQLGENGMPLRAN